MFLQFQTAKPMSALVAAACILGLACARIHEPSIQGADGDAVADRHRVLAPSPYTGVVLTYYQGTGCGGFVDHTEYKDSG